MTTMQKWLKANPWVIVNLASLGTMCGRFPTRESAEQHAASYRGGCVGVNDAAHEVYVSDMPSC